ncbi:hypothetical protein EV649_5054 [Kribbella sp. VKM Ac-2569]|uniref:hypothetical protein n=1 Tax=Kribbella sp. VKM Ac-2569 TaxID=2512220 RepID=UPI00102D02E0|nr:hypothetical protein [Kribbella sp. VKM Ac-2569]RZT17507.1 hypothetical protein EV649_5054 [Kribbella sp. VKM Ac-2569]
MSYHTAAGGELRLGPRIARGREGTVFRVLGADRTCVKIYSRPDAWLEARLAVVIAQPPTRRLADPGEHRWVAWPRAVVYDTDSRAVGFLMAEVHGLPLVNLYEAGSRAEALDDPTWATCVAIARELAAIFEALHPSTVVGDVSPNNVLVTRSGQVSLIDCDSMQFTDRPAGRIWPAQMVTPDYAPFSADGRGTVLTAEHDRFGLAILICELLMAGQHPYDGRPVGRRTEGRATNIRLGANRVTDPASLGHRPGLVPVTVLPPAVRRLMTEAFTAGTKLPCERPTAAMWVRALDGAADRISACARSPYHRFPRGLPNCVWCDLIAAGVGDHFPAPAPHSVQAPSPEPRQWIRKPPPPDYGHRPKPGAPPLPTWTPPRKTWKDR